jgi:hypothetical protein
MEALRQTQKKYCSRAITTAIFVGFFLILAGYRTLGKGLILGTVFSVVNFILIGETLPMRIGRSKEKTFFLSLGSILLRYVLLAIPLIMAIKMDQFNLFAVIFGIFMIQFVIVTDHLFNLILSARKKHS